jgi:hypothetical protein
VRRTRLYGDSMQVERGVERGQGHAVEPGRGNGEGVGLVGCVRDWGERAGKRDWSGADAQRYVARGDVRGIRVCESDFMQQQWSAVENGAG